MDLPEKAKRAPPAPVWNQSFPSPKALFVRGTFFIRCYPLVHSRGHSPIRNLGTRVAAVVPQLVSDTATATDTTYWAIYTPPVYKLLAYAGVFLGIAYGHIWWSRPTGLIKPCPLLSMTTSNVVIGLEF